MIIIANLFYGFYQAITLLLLARALMSWVVQDWSHPIPSFVYQVTEPILLPMRNLFYRMGWMNIGIDLSFLATWLLISYIGKNIYILLLSLA
ncbi:MAG: hypothetical protein CSB19_01255 [Clostridiales bacterium]|nr:MAG: hypothetical protein CSB19_01255 [Clostridiales bacterium]